MEYNFSFLGPVFIRLSTCVNNLTKQEKEKIAHTVSDYSKHAAHVNGKFKKKKEKIE